MNAERRQKTLLFLAATVVLLFGLDRFVLTPLSQKWTQQSETIAELRQWIDNGRAAVTREPATTEVWETMRGHALPEARSEAEQQLLEAFDQWSRKSGIAINALKPQWKRGDTEDYSLLEYRIDAAGSLENLARFLYELEESPLSLRIHTVGLSARDANGKDLSLELIVSGLRLVPWDTI